MSVTKRNLIAAASGILTALPAVGWAGAEVWGALKAADRIPVIEQRLEREEQESREIRTILLEMLMLQHKESGSLRRAQEVATELERLKKEAK